MSCPALFSVGMLGQAGKERRTSESRKALSKPDLNVINDSHPRRIYAEFKGLVRDTQSAVEIVLLFLCKNADFE